VGKNDSMGASVGLASGVAWLEKKKERPKKPIGDPIDREMKRSRRKNEEQSLTIYPSPTFGLFQTSAIIVHNSF